jgi:hypothetical protein
MVLGFEKDYVEVNNFEAKGQAMGTIRGKQRLKSSANGFTHSLKSEGVP